MSYDINFWKQERPLALSPQQIYERLNKKEPVEGLAKLPVDEILARLKATFPDFDPSESFPLARTSDGSIEFFWSDQHFRFDIRGICGDCQKLVDMMTDFDCPMYDPQEGKRYDSENGTSLGEKPKFQDATPEQNAQMEKLRAEMMAGFTKQPAQQKKGCAGSAAFLLVGLGALAWFAARRLSGGD